MVYIVVALLLSAYFNGTETVFTVFDRILAVGWVRARKFGGRATLFFSAHPQRFLSTTLIGNTVAQVSLSFLVVLWAEQTGVHRAWVVILTPLVVMVFCEILPKTIGYTAANAAVRAVSFPLLIFYYLALPVRMLIYPFVRIAARSKEEEERIVSQEPYPILRELDQILVGARAEGTVSPEEGEILTRYLDAREMKARDIMTPRTEMIAVNAEASPDQIRDVFRRHLHSILPVFEHDLDHIIGCLYARDLLREFASVREILHPIHAVPESKRLTDLLQEFKAGRTRIAIVIDEYGGTDGLITIKDVFEELVGAVAERWDPNEPVVKRLAPGKFLVSGAAFLEDIERVTGWNPPAGDYNTLSGLLADRLGRIAEIGEEIEFDQVTIRIIRRTPRRVEGCLLKLSNLPEDSESGA
jgi:putative hemolysin